MLIEVPKFAFGSRRRTEVATAQAAAEAVEAIVAGRGADFVRELPVVTVEDPIFVWEDYTAKGALLWFTRLTEFFMRLAVPQPRWGSDDQMYEAAIDASFGADWGRLALLGALPGTEERAEFFLGSSMLLIEYRRYDGVRFHDSRRTFDYLGYVALQLAPVLTAWGAETASTRDDLAAVVRTIRSASRADIAVAIGRFFDSELGQRLRGRHGRLPPPEAVRGFLASLPQEKLDRIRVVGPLCVVGLLDDLYGSPK